MDFSEKMAGLRPRYLARCAERMSDLAPLLAEAERLGESELAIVRRAFHDLAGTAGSLGLTRIGDEARKADELLLDVQKAGGALDNMQADVLRLHAENLRILIGEAQR